MLAWEMGRLSSELCIPVVDTALLGQCLVDATELAHAYSLGEGLAGTLSRP